MQFGGWVDLDELAEKLVIATTMGKGCKLTPEEAGWLSDLLVESMRGEDEGEVYEA
jgi:hypothetical protein